LYNISVNWLYQHLSFIIIIIIINTINFILHTWNGDKNAAWRLWMLLVFELFFVTSESPLCFPFLVPTLRLLESFLLQTWCSVLSKSLGNLHKKNICANLRQTNEYNGYSPSTSFLWLFTYCSEIYIVFSFWYFLIGYMCFLYCVQVLRWFWNRNMCSLNCMLTNT